MRLTVRIMDNSRLYVSLLHTWIEDVQKMQYGLSVKFLKIVQCIIDIKDCIKTCIHILYIQYKRIYKIFYICTHMYTISVCVSTHIRAQF